MADQAYLGQLAWRVKWADETDQDIALKITRQEILAAWAAAGEGRLPSQGPRGGKLWPHRYFIRHSAWHVLDHAWEIEDRVIH